MYSSLNCRTVREDCLWIEEGRRSICITYRYDVDTGCLKYAASVFRRRELNSSEVTTYWTEDGDEYDPPREGVPYYTDGDILYLDLDQDDFENHHQTTTRRYQIRPARVVVDAGLCYDDLIKTIRWEMCHGAGCRGPRKARKSGRSQSPESVCSDVSSISDYRVSDETHEIKTEFRARYCIDGRVIFIVFKGRPSTGEILYGATIHRPDADGSFSLADHDSVESSPAMTRRDVEAHYQTAEDRLHKCPVHFKIPSEMRAYKKQLKRSAPHREDLTILMVDNIFERRGGFLQIRGEREETTCGEY